MPPSTLPLFFSSTLILSCFRWCAQTFTIQFCLFPFQPPLHPCSLQHGEVHTLQFTIFRTMYLTTALSRGAGGYVIPHISALSSHLCEPVCSFFLHSCL